MDYTNRTIRLDIKSVAEDGTFEGLLSPYGNVDQGGDVVEAGAFSTWLKANGNTVPMLWQHKPDCPIGELHLEDRSDGLWCAGKLLLDIAEAQKAYLLLKAGIIKGLSIGYETVKAKTIDGVRHLVELKLFEGSVVTFPMNTLAGVTSVKEGRKVSAETHKTLNAAHDHMMAACKALKGLLEPLDDDCDPADEQACEAETEDLKACTDLLTKMIGLLR